MKVSGPELLLYEAVRSGNISSIPPLFKNWVLLDADRLRIEDEVRKIAPILENLHLGAKDILWEGTEKIYHWAPVETCYIHVSRIINAANQTLQECGANLVSAASEGKIVTFRELLQLPILPDSLGKSLVAAAEGGRHGILRMLKWHIKRRHLLLAEDYYKEAFKQILGKKESAPFDVNLLMELLDFPIATTVLGYALILAIQGKKIWALNSLKKEIRDRGVLSKELCCVDAMEETIKIDDPQFLSSMLSLPITHRMFGETLVNVAKAGKSSFLEIMRQAMQVSGYSLKTPDYLNAIGLMMKRDDALSFSELLKFPMDPAEAIGKILLTLVAKSSLEFLNILKQAMRERGFLPDFWEYRRAVDAAFDKGDVGIIAALRDLPLPMFVKVDHFKEATKIAAAKGRFTILYRYFSLWKIPALNEPEIFCHTHLLKEEVDTFFKDKSIEDEEEIIAFLKCTAMGSSVLSNPLLNLRSFNCYLYKVEISDALRELLFDIALECKTIEALHSILNGWEMSDEIKERIKGKVDRLEPSLKIYKELCLPYLSKKRRRQW